MSSLSNYNFSVEIIVTKVKKLQTVSARFGVVNPANSVCVGRDLRTSGFTWEEKATTQSQI